MATSKDFNAKNAIAEIKKLVTAAEVNAFVENEERKSVLNAAQAVLDAPSETPAEAPAKKGPAIPQKRNVKMGDPAECLKAYDALILVLAKTEAKQRIAKKPARIYFIHRRRAEVMRLNMIKSMR